MQNVDDIIFGGGLNTDDDPRMFQKGDYLEARNIRIGSTQDQGDDGLVQSIKSTLKVSIEDSIPNLGTIEYYGSVVDEETKMSYILAISKHTNDNAYFIIFKHNLISNTISIIFRQLASTWGMKVWDADMQKIYNPVIVDHNLIWTDNVNDVRMINVNRSEISQINAITSARIFNQSFCNSPGYENNELVFYNGLIYKANQQTDGEYHTPDYPGGSFDLYGSDSVVAWNQTDAYDTGYEIGTLVYYRDYVYRVIQDTYHAPGEPGGTLLGYYTLLCKIIDCYFDLRDPNNFTLASQPPLISPTSEYITDKNQVVNQLRGKTFQFSYRYIYMDWRRSTFAPPSLVQPPNKEETTDGTPNSDPSLNNAINIYINSGNEEVRTIEIIARDSDDIASWYKFKDVSIINDLDWRIYPSNDNITITFYNNEAKTLLDPTLVYTPFSYVPIKAKHMELLEGNILSLANITEGYGKIRDSVTVDLSWEDPGSSLISTYTIYVSKMFAPDSNPNLNNWMLKITLPNIENLPGTFSLSFKKYGETSFRTITYDHNGIDAYPSTVRTELISLFIAEWGAGEVTPCISLDNYSFCVFPVQEYYHVSDSYLGWEWVCKFDSNTIRDIDKFPSLSTGFTHSWGIVYRDAAGRMSPIIGAGNISKYIPFSTESASIGISKIPNISFKINHTPPDWAYSYEIIYAGNNSSNWFLDVVGYDYAKGKQIHTDPLDLGTHSDNQEYRIKLTLAQANARSFFKNWSVEEYVWSKGDRIRIIGTIDVSGVLTPITSGIWDTEITGIFTDTDYSDFISATPTEDNTWLYFKSSSTLELIPSNPPTVSLYFQIYRLKVVSETTIYFTTGMTFRVLTNNYGDKYHEGDTDQVLNSSGVSIMPASVNNTSHDAWKYTRLFRNKENIITWSLWADSQYCGDFNIMQILTSSGNPIPNIDSLKQNILTKRIRHGGNLNIGSQINNISDFDYINFVDLKDEDGPIEGLRIVGFTLKVLQRTKVSSIFINRTESYNANGSPDYQFTNKVFGGVRPNEENWGTSHPDSVVVQGRHLYYWDQSEGVVVRDAPNGSFAISDYKMKRYFGDKAKQLDLEDKQDQVVVFAASVETEELFCMFGVAEASKEIITFREKDSRWKYMMDLDFEKGLFYWMGKRLFHISDTMIYEWWMGSDYSSINEIESEGKLVFYSIGSPIKPKIFNSIIVYQNGGEPEFESVIIPEKATSGEGEMETRIYPSNTERREGIYYCQVLRDINDPKPATQNSKLSNGRVLRGLYAKITMLFSGNTKKTLSNVSVLTTPSERSR